MRTPDFNKGTSGLLPAIVQDALTREVLMLGYMNEESYKLTESTRKLTFFSRSRNALWVKGETSGNYVEVEKLMVDCDSDTILVFGNPTGPVCHLNTPNCFDENSFTLKSLEKIIKSRKESGDEKSYTSRLFNSGLKKIAQKVGEEASEILLEAESGSDERLISETADLMYHLLVLLRARNINLAAIEKELEKRSGS
jgi:phosphoribosyl-AMP cyclohydrolase / phosphoribosyl-ATP pyrophosphohydrolase